MSNEPPLCLVTSPSAETLSNLSISAEMPLRLVTYGESPLRLGHLLVFLLDLFRKLATCKQGEPLQDEPLPHPK